MSTIIRNLVGQKFGRLLVVKQSHNRVTSGGRQRVFWSCLCDCGNSWDAPSESLIKGHVKSCGCFRKDFRRNPDAPLTILMGRYKGAARARHRKFTITKEEFRKITSSDCFYCGSKPTNVITSWLGILYFWNGLDRVDNNIGYEISNVIPCCSFCNQAKHTNTQEVFLDWINRLVEYRNRNAVTT